MLALARSYNDLTLRHTLGVSIIAQRQHGHITRAQLLALGFSARVTSYTVARAMAAVLACGDGAVLSHDSAAALWGP
jgi:hypothetical protein